MSVQKRNDFPSIIEDLKRRVSTLEKVSRLHSASIGSGGLTIRDEGNLTVKDGGDVHVQDGGDLTVEGGDLTVQGGGNLRVQDGGTFTVDDEGQMHWLDAGGNLRLQMGRIPPDTLPGLDSIRLVYRDANEADRVIIGEIYNLTTSQIDGHGIIIQPPNSDVDQLHITNSAAGIAVLNGTGIQINEAAPGKIGFFRPNRTHIGFNVAIDTAQTRLFGGVAGDGGIASMITLRSDFEVWCRDGADNTYIPIAASSFITRTSSEATKDVLGDVEPGALDKVRATPVKRWRHTTAPATDAGETAEAPVRLGPMVEDVPQEMADGGGIDLAATVWTLWAALQESDTRVAAAEARVTALEADLAALHKRLGF